MEENIKVVVFDIFGVLMNTDGEVDKGVFDILKELDKKKLSLSLCSNTPRRMLEIWDSKYDFLKYFKEMILSENLQVNKPDPQVFKEILNRYENILPQEILFVDDKEENILGAEAEGMTGIQFKDADSFRKELEKLGTV